MPEVIPLIPNVPRQSLVASLGGQETRLVVWWQPSDEAWYASLESPVDVPVISSRRLVTNGAVIGPRNTGFVGDLYVQATSQSTDEPGFNAWAETHALVYA